MPTRLAAALQRAAEFLCALMFAAVFAIFCFKIVRRYAAGDAVAWGDEVCVVLFIWIVFLANAFVVEDKKQIAFDLIVDKLSPEARCRVEIARICLVGGILAAALPTVVEYTLFLWRERTPVLLWRLDYAYACFAIFIAAVIVRYASRLVALARARGQGA